MAPQDKLRIYHGLAALFAAITISWILMWIWSAVGPWAAWTALIGTILSSWLTVFGRNLWWFIGAFYVPYIVLAWALRRKGSGAITLGLAAMVGILTKCYLTGYEYITTALITMIIPLVYQAIAERWPASATAKAWCTVVLGAVFAVALSVLLLCAQIYALTGSRSKGIEHLMYSLGKRTYGNSQQFPVIYAASLSSSGRNVIAIYLKGNYFLGIKYWQLLLLFIAGSFVLWRSRPSQSEKAYVIATWVSLLAPISWFILFKAHSFIHTYMNFIVWQMPFTLLGFGVVGCAIQRALLLIRRNAC